MLCSLGFDITLAWEEGGGYNSGIEVWKQIQTSGLLQDPVREMAEIEAIALAKEEKHIRLSMLEYEKEESRKRKREKNGLYSSDSNRKKGREEG